MNDKSMDEAIEAVVTRLLTQDEIIDKIVIRVVDRMSRNLRVVSPAWRSMETKTTQKPLVSVNFEEEQEEDEDG